METFAGPIICLFTHEHICSKNIALASALFSDSVLFDTDRTLALKGAVQFGLDFHGNSEKHILESPEAVAFARHLYVNLPALPWLAALDTELLSLIISCVPDDGTRLVKRQGERLCEVSFDAGCMEKVVLDMCRRIYLLTERAGLPDHLAQERCRELRAYVRRYLTQETAS